MRWSLHRGDFMCAKNEVIVQQLFLCDGIHSDKSTASISLFLDNVSLSLVVC